APENRAAFLVDLEHVPLSVFSRKPKDPLKHHCDVAHQVHGIVVHYDLPWKIAFFGSSSFLLDCRTFDRELYWTGHRINRSWLSLLVGPTPPLLCGSQNS